MAERDEGFIASSIRATVSAGKGIVRFLREVDKDTASVDLVPGHIDALGTAVIKLGSLAVIERANSHEILAEEHVLAEMNALLDRAKGRELADGATQSVAPSSDPMHPKGKPEFGNDTHVIFVNGINTSAPRAIAETQMLAGRLHQDVQLVYVETRGIPHDVATAYGETMNPTAGRTNPPERALASAIETQLDRGQNVHVIAYSRGALVTQLALENVKDHYMQQGHDAAWVEEHINSRISVETFNGASHHIPAGVKAEHYVSKADYLVANTIGMGAPAPAFREMAAHSIDAALAAISDLSPAQKATFQGDSASVARDVAALGVPLTPLDPIESLMGGVNQNLSRLERDLATAAHDAAAHRAATPGQDELNRDGSANTPNGPIHSAPVFVDVDAIDANDPGGWLVAQHDLPGMLPSRAGHTVDAAHIRGSASPAEKVRVDRAIPERMAGGGQMPPARDISTWNGKSASGTVFEVDKETYAMHTGRGAFVVIDVDRFPGGKAPPNNAYIDLAPSGRFTVEPQHEQQQHLGR